jgi:hypothetical protein
MKTTLNKIRKHGPCSEGWSKLLAHLGKTKADDEPLSIATIVESNGLDDALWCLRAVDGFDKEIRLYAVWCARQVQHLMTDPRSLAVLDVVEAYAYGNATDKDLAEARNAARDAAMAAARNEARNAAWNAARDAAWNAAWDAARDAALAAAWDAALAEAMAEAMAAAWDAARYAAQDAQKKELLRICAEIDAAPEKGNTQ